MGSSLNYGPFLGPKHSAAPLQRESVQSEDPELLDVELQIGVAPQGFGFWVWEGEGARGREAGREGGREGRREGGERREGGQS